MKWLLLVTWFWTAPADSYQVGFVDEAACRNAAKTLRAETGRLRVELETRKATASRAMGPTQKFIPRTGPLAQVTAVCVRAK